MGVDEKKLVLLNDLKAPATAGQILGELNGGGIILIKDVFNGYLLN